MQIHLGPSPPHMNTITTPGYVLVMQRLVQVADKMYHKLGRDIPLPERQLWVQRLQRVVRQRRHHAPRILTITLEVDVAPERRVILCVDEVECLGETPPLGVADGVGPGGDVGHVVIGLVVEDVLEVGFCSVGDEVRGEVG